MDAQLTKGYICIYKYYILRLNITRYGLHLSSLRSVAAFGKTIWTIVNRIGGEIIYWKDNGRRAERTGSDGTAPDRSQSVNDALWRISESIDEATISIVSSEINRKQRKTENTLSYI